METLYVDGDTAHVGLTDRVVYDDLNNNGHLDPGEPSSSTDLDGLYKLFLPRGTQTLRTVELSGWVDPTNGTSSRSVVVSGPDPVGPTFTVRMSRPVVVDVLASYTVAALDGRDKHQIATFIRSLFVDANQVFSNSNTNVLIEPVAIARTTYRETGSIDDDLDNLGNGSGLLAATQKLQDADHADLSVLFTSGNLTSGDDIGVAYEYDPTDPDPSENGYSTVALQEDGSDGFTLAHELGHNFGAGHDQPDNDGLGVTSYAYGYHFIGANGRLYQDVMDYSNGTILPFFSTPDFTWEGEAIGNAKHADNARIILEEAPAVANYE